MEPIRTAACIGINQEGLQIIFAQEPSERAHGRCRPLCGWLVNSNLSNSEVSAASLQVPRTGFRQSHCRQGVRCSTDVDLRYPTALVRYVRAHVQSPKPLPSYSTETTYFGHSAA